jgi:hypothetical protein
MAYPAPIGSSGWQNEPDTSTPLSAANLNSISYGYRFVETVYFTSSGNFVKANYPWLRAIRVIVVGGGGAGGGGAAASNGSGWQSAAGGGGGGATAERFITNIASLSSSETITVGASAAGVTGNTTGTAGNSSVAFGITCGGGAGGAGSPQSNSAASVSGGAGGTVSGTSDIQIPGQRGGDGAHIPGSQFMFAGTGGSSRYGAGGQRGAVVSGAIIGGGTAGGNRGGGGSGSFSANSGANPTSGAGAAGIVIVELYA